MMAKKDRRGLESKALKAKKETTESAVIQVIPDHKDQKGIPEQWDQQDQKVTLGQWDHKAYKESPAFLLWGYEAKKETTESAVIQVIPDHKDQKGIPEQWDQQDQKVTPVDQSVPQVTKAKKDLKVKLVPKVHKETKGNKGKKDPRVKLVPKAHKEK